MTNLRMSRWILLLTLGLADASLVAADDKSAAPAPIKVLFIGNSQIFYNDLPKLLEALAESAPADRPRIKADQLVAGGASLERHWNRGDGEKTAREKIAAEKWDYVIIQEIYYGKPDSFNQYARLFDELIRRQGAKTILFSTASINKDYPQGFHQLHDMHVALGKELKVPVAVGGKAWLTYWGDNPTEAERLDLYHADKAHPGVKGSYINACAIYAAITGLTPVGLTNRLPNLPEETLSPVQAKRFQEAAWHVHQQINGKAAESKP